MSNGCWFRIRCQDLAEYIADQENEVHDPGYAGEKITALKIHAGAAFGLDGDGGHGVHQHCVWLIGAVDRVRFGVLGR